ncbi:MAG TPA: fibronectin type III domain-containing protein [Acidimicrobiales bacterium]|nr:fibronectin type III domain-containing protein [Acidimicrobiales bacterium]
MNARVRILTRSGFGACVAASVFGLLCGTAFAWTVTLNAGSSAQAASYGAPAAPTGVSAVCTSGTATTIKVTWSATARATTYTVSDSITGSGGLYTTLASGISGLTYTTAALTPGSTYFFKVNAVSGSNWSGALSTASAGHLIGIGTCS